MNKIERGEYEVDQKLPSERKLCEIYGVSRITVRQTLKELENEGYIYRVHGKGTFISPKTFHQQLVKLYSFTEEMKKIGKVPSVRVLSFVKIQADERLSRHMGIEKDEEVFQVVRLRLADNEPLMYETSHLPAQIFPRLTQKDLQDYPMYEVFQRDYDISVTSAIEKFSATVIRTKEAEYLETSTNHPAMLVKRYAFYRERIIEYTVSVTRGEKFDYIVELNS